MRWPPQNKNRNITLVPRLSRPASLNSLKPAGQIKILKIQNSFKLAGLLKQGTTVIPVSNIIMIMKISK